MKKKSTGASMSTSHHIPVDSASFKLVVYIEHGRHIAYDIA